MAVINKCNGAKAALLAINTMKKTESKSQLMAVMSMTG
jgi:hypothetical protein